MEFLSLSNVLNALAQAIELEPHFDSLGDFQNDAYQTQVTDFWAKNNPQIEWARKRAVAAQSLNKALHHPVGTLPRSMEHNEDMGFAVENDSVKPEIIKSLILITKWGSLLQNRCASHIRDTAHNGPSSIVDPDYVQRQYQDIASEMMRQQKIGFDLHEAILFFDKNELAHAGLVEAPLVRTQHARDLNVFYARIVRGMLAEGDKKGLRDTGCGTEDEARVMLRCYELATLMWWDIEALADASDFDGFGLKFGESREAVERRLNLAMKGKEVAEVLRPIDGVALLYRLGITVVEELEETVSYLNGIGFYGTEAEGMGSVNSEPEDFASMETGLVYPQRAPTPAEDSATAPANAKVEKMKKAVLVKKYGNQWPSVEADFGNVSRNGLDSARVSSGVYNVSAALEWAKQNGKLSETAPFATPANSIHNSPRSVKHTLDG